MMQLRVTIANTTAILSAVYSDFFYEVAQEYFIPLCRTLTLSRCNPEKHTIIELLIKMMVSNPQLVLSTYLSAEAAFFTLLSFTIRGFEGFEYPRDEESGLVGVGNDFSRLKFSVGEVSEDLKEVIGQILLGIRNSNSEW